MVPGTHRLARSGCVLHEAWPARLAVDVGVPWTGSGICRISLLGKDVFVGLVASLDDRRLTWLEVLAHSLRLRIVTS